MSQLKLRATGVVLIYEQASLAERCTVIGEVDGILLQLSAWRRELSSRAYALFDLVFLDSTYVRAPHNHSIDPGIEGGASSYVPNSQLLHQV